MTRCSICGGTKNLMQYDKAYICEDCIDKAHDCSEMIQSGKFDMEFFDKFNMIIQGAYEEPVEEEYEEIKGMLDEYVIGQDKAKKILSVAVYNHMKRIYGQPVNANVELQKSNILMLGPTGCGKTLLAKTLARILNVPFAIADATTFTEAGYVGEDVEIVLKTLIENADGDISAAEHGIVFIDEIDKIGRKSENPSITRDVSGEGVQQTLLKIIEGSEVRVPTSGMRKHPQADCITIDTSNILFICGGAFEGIDKLKAERCKKTVSMGFTSCADTDDIADERLLPEDIVKFGIMPELLGRLPIVVSLEELDETALVAALTNVKNSVVSQYTELMARDEVKLTFEPAALAEIAKLSIKRGTGARGLRSIVEDLMLDVMYKTPSDDSIEEIIITKNAVLGGDVEIKKKKKIAS